MATATTTTACPGKVCTCGGTEQVTVRRGTSKGRATIVYGPCAPLVAQGWTGKVALVEWA